MKMMRALPAITMAFLFLLISGTAFGQTLVRNTGGTPETSVTIGKPIGYYDGQGGTGTNKYAWCWTIDPGDPSAALPIGMTIDSSPVGFIQPNILRTDVIAAYGGGQVKHGCAMGFAPKYYTDGVELRTVGLYGIRFGDWHELSNSPRVVRLVRPIAHPESIITIYVGQAATGQPMTEYASTSLWKLDPNGFFQEVSWYYDYDEDNGRVIDGKLVFRKDLSDYDAGPQNLGCGTYKIQLWGSQNFKGGWTEPFDFCTDDVYAPPIFLSRRTVVEIQGFAINGKAKFTVSANVGKADIMATFYSNTPSGYYEVAERVTVALKPEGTEFEILFPKEALGFGVCGQFLLTEPGKPANLLGANDICLANPLLK